MSWKDKFELTLELCIFKNNLYPAFPMLKKTPKVAYNKSTKNTAMFKKSKQGIKTLILTLNSKTR